jgi:hypothetical protein
MQVPAFMPVQLKILKILKMTTLHKYYMPLFFPLKKEHCGLLLLIVLFFLFPHISRQIDITSAPIDPGALSAVILAVLALLAFKACTWWLMRSVWPLFAEYSNEHFERNFKSLLSWQKVCIYLSFYLLLLYSFVATLAALI